MYRTYTFLKCKGHTVVEQALLLVISRIRRVGKWLPAKVALRWVNLGRR